MAMSFIQRVALRFSLSKGGKVVERWWKGGGKVVEGWWKGGGKVVERWWKGGAGIRYPFSLCFTVQSVW